MRSMRGSEEPLCPPWPKFLICPKATIYPTAEEHREVTPDEAVKCILKVTWDWL